MSKKQTNALDPEIAAMGIVHKALQGLAQEAQIRVLNYVADKLGIHLSQQESGHLSLPNPPEPPEDSHPHEPPPAERAGPEEVLEGISPVAKKWMSRNGLGASPLSTVFSLGVDEIDLIAEDVPGRNKKDRMRSVLLLKGIAAYLGTGAARFTHEQIKEACLHYDAYDSANFATHLKSFSGEVTGSKESGYNLTARGLSAAAELLKQMLNLEKKSNET